MELEAILTRKRMKRSDLARECSLARSTVTRHLKGQAQPTMKALIQYSRVLKIPLSRLVKIFDDQAENGTVNN